MTFRDLKRAVHDHKLDVREVRTGVCEVARLQLHVVRAGVRAAHARVAAETEVGFGVQRIADRDRVTRHRLLSTVVQLGAAVLCDRHRHLVRQCRHFQLA